MLLIIILIVTTTFSFRSRETTDSYSIAASPSFGNLRRGSIDRYSFCESKTSLLSKESIVEEEDDLERISIAQLSVSEKASLYSQLTGELPIGHGCSFSQTIFNGKQAYTVLNWS